MNENNAKRLAGDKSRVIDNMQKIKYKIVILSGKGGVGKSTVATNLAFSLSMHGFEVGLLDIDITGPNIPKMLGIEDKRLAGNETSILPFIVSPHLKVISMAFLLKDRDTPVIWRGPLKMKAIQQFLGDVVWGDLDYLIIDLPPGTGDEPLSIAQLIPDSVAVIVTTPQDVALLDSRKAVTFARALKTQVIGIIENMSGLTCPYCGKEINLFKVGGGENAAKEMNVHFLGKLPIDPNIVETGDSGEPFIVKYPDSSSAKAFAEIVKKIDNIANKGR
ncbi:MAG: Mrp/NBP35 family ATP-binding protein [Candidatus Thermoplasmatota archaeon]|nr:Mrp/NBP35 family ATP-binding protein [Candidatus Thermoplasmatota archaeon]